VVLAGLAGAAVALAGVAPASAAPAARDIGDACPAGGIPEDGFTDVPGSNVHERAIDCIRWWEVTVQNGSYGAGSDVQRGQMASFLARTVVLTGGTLPDSPPDAFNDDNGTTHERATNQLAAVGVVEGKGGGRYAPAEGVSRAQMAAFLVRTAEYRTGTPLPPGEDAFTDDEGNTHEPAIDKAAAAGITGGSSTGGYAPEEIVRRDQMGSFLARLLDLLVESGTPRKQAAPPPATTRTARTSRPTATRRPGSTTTSRSTATWPSSTRTGIASRASRCPAARPGSSADSARQRPGPQLPTITTRLPAGSVSWSRRPPPPGCGPPCARPAAVSRVAAASRSSVPRSRVE
jgi:hypothetical protein